MPMEIHGEKEHHWDVIDDHLKDGNNFSSLKTRALGMVARVLQLNYNVFRKLVII